MYLSVYRHPKYQDGKIKPIWLKRTRSCFELRKGGTVYAGKGMPNLIQG